MISPPAPPTDKQLALMHELCAERRVEFRAPTSKRDAQREIGRLIAMPRAAAVGGKAPHVENDDLPAIVRQHGWRFGVGQRSGEERAEIAPRSVQGSRTSTCGRGMRAGAAPTLAVREDPDDRRVPPRRRRDPSAATRRRRAGPWAMRRGRLQHVGWRRLVTGQSEPRGRLQRVGEATAARRPRRAVDRDHDHPRRRARPLVCEITG